MPPWAKAGEAPKPDLRIQNVNYVPKTTDQPTVQLASYTPSSSSTSASPAVSRSTTPRS